MRENLRQAFELFAECVNRRELLCEDLTEEEFEEKLFPERKDVIPVFFSSPDGFACGHVDLGLKKRFVTMVIVRPAKRQRGAGRTLLATLEQELLKAAPAGGLPGVLEISFYNPVTFTWRIPGIPSAYHPNMPGVDDQSGACAFFHACGYRTFAVEDSYYLALEDYVPSEEIRTQREALKREGIEFLPYDAKTHRGMEEMLKKLGNPLWERSIPAEPPVEEGGRPILAPVRDGIVYGFAGPVEAESGGRGYFDGIAVDEALRGRGAGKVLFAELCQRERQEGARFMTLFTGKDNPAQKIYRAAGFSVVRTWEDMRK